jgi:hypothetical protein
MGRDKIPFLAKAVMTSAREISARLDASAVVELDLAGKQLH